MESAEINTVTSPVSSTLSPLQSLLKEVFASATKNNWDHILPPPNKIQQIKQLIIKFHACRKYIDPTRIWELDDDSFLIRIENVYPTTYFVRCTLKQAIHLDISQIPLIPYITSSMSDLDKEILRINNVFTKFADASPFIFEVQINVTRSNTSSSRAYISQKNIVEILLAHAPLVPKSTYTKRT